MTLVRWKRKLLWLERSVVIAACAAMTLLFSCSKLSETELWNDGKDAFAGATSLLPQGDGTWLLQWDALNNRQAIYRVYSRVLSGAYDFSAPTATTAKNSYKTENLSGKETQCYMVRSLSDGLNEDGLTLENCTSDTKNLLAFEGLRLLAPNRDGSFALAWTALKNSDVIYNIYLRTKSEKWDFSTVSWTTRESTYKVPAPAFGDSVCYLVRYSGKGLVADENNKEICSNAESLADFTGVQSATSVVEGVVELKWLLAKNPKVNEYHIYKDTKFEKLVGTAAKTMNSFTLTGLLPGELARVGVRAADAAGREDFNTKTIATKVACITTCNTPPETPESPTLNLVPPGKTGGTVICTANYKEVDADGTNLIPTFHFYNAKAPEKPRLSLKTDPGVKTAIYQLKSLQDTGSITTAEVRDDLLYCSISLTDGIVTVTSLPSANLVKIANAAPVITHSEARSLGENELLSFNIGALDPDGDALTLTCLSGCPLGMSFDASSGAVTWTPIFGQAGVYTPVFSASDGIANTTQAISITVLHTNRVPVFASVLAKSIEKLSLLSFRLSAEDPDGSSVTYSCKAPCPGGLTIHPTSGEVRWTPSGNQVGLVNVVFAASDGLGEGAVTVPVTVRNVNHAPVLAAIPAQSSNEMQPLSFSLTASDVDGDTIAYRCASFCPTGLSVNAATGVVQWTPSYTQSGIYTVTLEASDGDKTDTKAATITVIDVNRAPLAVTTLTAPNPAYNDSTFHCSSIGSSDPDLDDLNHLTITYQWLADSAYIAGATSSQLTLQAVGGLYNGAAIRCEVGVSDGKVSSPVTARSSAVTLQNRAPTARASISPASPRRTDTLTCNTNTSTDPDGDPLIFSYIWRKDGSVLAGQNDATLASAQLANHSSFDCSITADDSHGGTNTASSATITIQNQAPTLAAISAQTVNEGQTLAFSLAGADPDNDALSYRCSANCPTELAVSTGGNVSWLPSFSQSGVYTVTFEVSDGVETVTQTATITVVDVNQPPIPVAMIIAPSPLYNNGTLFCVSAGTTDPDPADAISLVISYKWVANSAYIAGETTSQLTLSGAAGMYVGQTIQCEVAATDGHIAQPVTTRSLGVVVANRNPVVVAAVNPNSPTQADTLSCATGLSTDSDGDTLAFSYLWKKDGVVINGETSVTLASAFLTHFSTYTCEATANDGHGGVTTIVAANVTVQNREPTGTIASGNATTQDVPADGAITPITLFGSDPDGDSVTFVQTAGAASCPNIIIDANTGVISGRVQRVDETPARSASCTLFFRVKDQYNALSTSDLVVTVNSSNRSPTVSCTHQTSDAGSTVTAGACTFGDSDLGSTLTYSSSGCGLGITAAGMLTGTIPATTCTASVTVSDGSLSTSGSITLTPYLSLSMAGSNTLSNTCQLSVPGTVTYSAGATYASASGTLSNGSSVTATESGFLGTITNPTLGNFNLSWTVNSAGLASSTTLNKTLSLTTQAIGQTPLQILDPAPLSGRIASMGSELPKAGCGSSCSTGLRGQIVSNQQGTFCARMTSGGVACWGRNDYTQTGVPVPRASPVKVTRISDAIKLKVSGNNNYSATVCVLRSDRTIACWGSGGSGGLGNGSTTDSLTPVTVSGITNATDLSMGTAHACAIDGGLVKCWGENAWGPLGDGTQTSRSTPVTVPGLSGMTKVGAGSRTSCASSPTAGLWCWGINSDGQTGNGNTTSPQLTPQQFRSTSDVLFNNVVDFAVGSFSICALLATGDIWCSGANNSRQLGDLTTNSSSKAVQVKEAGGAIITNAVSVQAGYSGFCAKRSDSSLWCWGNGFPNWNGTGSSGTQNAVALTGFAGGAPATTDWFITPNTAKICAIPQSTHLAKCWGNFNDYGSLGNGSTASTSVATDVVNLPAVTSIAIGTNNMCALTVEGDIYCWGANHSGQLGFWGAVISVPTVLPGLSNVVSVIPAYNVTMALLADGTVKSWGGGYYASSSAITTVATVSGVVDLVVTKDTSTAKCALLNDGSVQCWGDNSYGQLGDNTTTTRSSTAAPVQIGLGNGESVAALAAGLNHLCIIVAPNGTVKCWGRNNYGQVGLLANTPDKQLVPATVAGLSGVKALSLGNNFSCALLSDSTVKCWGYNSGKQLWDGTTISRSTPAPVVGVSNVVSMFSGPSSNCVIMSNGTASCWGSSFYPGDGTTPSSNGFGNVVNLSNPIIAGAVSWDDSIFKGTTCVLDSAGAIYCWGNNRSGQLGQGMISSTLGLLLPTVPSIGSYAAWSNCSSYVLAQ